MRRRTTYEDASSLAIVAAAVSTMTACNTSSAPGRVRVEWRLLALSTISMYTNAEAQQKL